jgi:3-methylcrotonyl-CoA carboxylase alpha subunit
MPGRVVSVEVAEGDQVVKGTKLVVVEAMKMEFALVAPFDGVVAELRARLGDQVSEGTLLVRIDQREG